MESHKGFLITAHIFIIGSCRVVLLSTCAGENKLVESSPRSYGSKGTSGR